MPDKDYATKFKQWFADMQERYQQYYGGYEDLFQEAFEAGAKQEREACAKVCDKEVEEWKYDADVVDVAIAIRARGQT